VSALFIVLLVDVMAFCASWQLIKFCSKLVIASIRLWWRI